MLVSLSIYVFSIDKINTVLLICERVYIIVKMAEQDFSTQPVQRREILPKYAYNTDVLSRAKKLYLRRTCSASKRRASNRLRRKLVYPKYGVA